MSTLLDMVGSFVVGGLLLLMILNVNGNVSDQSTLDQLELTVQENMAELVNEIEFDFRKIGYHVPNAALSIVRVDTSAIIFRGDIDNNGTVDSISYVLESPANVHGTVNPRDRILRRSVNGVSQGGSLGVVRFLVTVRDISGAVTTDLTLVKVINYSLVVENAFPIDTTYARSAWTGTVRPKNL
jgi:hypothetical protein